MAASMVASMASQAPRMACRSTVCSRKSLRETSFLPGIQGMGPLNLGRQIFSSGRWNMVAATPSGLDSTLLRFPNSSWSAIPLLPKENFKRKEEQVENDWEFDPLGLGEDARSSLADDMKYLISTVFCIMEGKAPNRPGPQGQSSPKTSRNNPVPPSDDSKIEPGDFFKGDLPKKFLILLGLLILSRIGIYIPLWGVNREAFSSSLGEGSILAALDTFSGGGIGRLGIFSLGIVPYINAQIVFQLLGTFIPSLQELQKKEGEAGRKKVQRYTKFASIGFALVQAIGQVLYLKPYVYDFSPSWAISAISALTLGSAAVIFISDKLSDLKLGNGTSLLIFTNIVSYLPATLGRTIDEGLKDGNIGGGVFMIVSFLLLVFGIVYVQEAERRIPINYAQRYSRRASSLNRADYLPFKVNSTGVMPIIFSTSLLAAPASLARFTGAGFLQTAAVALNPGGVLYLPTNVVLIAFFNYFYTFLQLDPADVSDQLKKQGASIPNIRPGKATATFITNVLSRISVLGSAFLGSMALAPAIVEGVTHLTAFRGFAGTSVLILVGCATDTARKVQAELVSQKYKSIEIYDIDNNNSSS